jgi:hypothetical protein
LHCFSLPFHSEEALALVLGLKETRGYMNQLLGLERTTFEQMTDMAITFTRKGLGSSSYSLSQGILLIRLCMLIVLELKKKHNALSPF